MNASLASQKLQSCLDRLAQETPAERPVVRAELFQLCSERISRRARAMLRDYSGLARWEDSDDVAQEASVRLLKALDQLKPRTVQDLDGLIALQIRRALIDLVRRHKGRKGTAARKGWEPLDSAALPERAGVAEDPHTLVLWGELHERVWQLPVRQREVFVLLWYEGLSQDEAAAVFGVDRSTVKRWWRSARVMLTPVITGVPSDGAECHCAI